MCYIENIKKRIIPLLIFGFYIIFRKKTIFYISNYRFGSFSESLLILDIFISVILILLIKLIYKENFNSIDSSKKINFKKSIIISVFTLFFVIVIMFFINKILLFIFNPNNIISGNASNVLSSIRINPLPIIGLSFATSILEEIVYRRILFGYFYDLHSGCNKYVRFITSALISSIIFGATHDGVFHLAMFHYVTAGFILSGLYLFTKRLSSPIIVHILYNLFLDMKMILL